MIWKLKDFVVSSNLEYFGDSSSEIDSGGAIDEIISLGNQGRRRATEGVPYLAVNPLKA
jgi:hypothetical protein